LSDVDRTGAALHVWKGDEHQILALPDCRVADGRILDGSHVELRNRVASLEHGPSPIGTGGDAVEKASNSPFVLAIFRVPP
jgi:hypothetical protein